MEERTYTIDNVDYLTLDSSPSIIQVTRGRGYLFAIKKREDGSLGARREVATYEVGDFCPNLPGIKDYIFILTGIEDTQVTVLSATTFSSEELQEKHLFNLHLFFRLNSQAQEEIFKCPSYQNQIQIIQDVIIQQLEDEEIHAQKRSVQRQKDTHGAYKRTIASIASVTNKTLRGYESQEEGVSDIVKAFSLVAAKVGIPLKNSMQKEYNNNKAGLQALARDNTIRIREVVLRDKWYKHDNGHLVAFYKESGPIDLSKSTEIEENCTPVALVQKDNLGGYLIINPKDDSEIPVTKHNALNVFPKAFMMYKTIGEEKLTIKEICLFVLRDIKGDAIRFFLTGILCTLIGLIIPEITRNFIDQVIPRAAKNLALQICFLVFMCNMAGMLANLAKYFAMARMEIRADSNLQTALMDRLLKMPVNFFKNYTSGNLASRVMSITSIRSEIYNIIVSVIMNLIFSITYLIQEFRYCAYLAKWGFLFCLIPIAVSTVLCFITYKWQKLLINSQGKIAGMLFQYLSGMEKITNTNGEKQIFGQWAQAYVQQTKYAFALAQVGNMSAIINGVLPALISMAMYYLLGTAISTGKVPHLSTGSFMAFLTAFGSFQTTIMSIANALLSIRNLGPQINFIQPILDEKLEIQESKPQMPPLTGKVEIDHVSFRYLNDSPLVLDDVSIRVDPGEFVAIVGNSGAGKSTLLRLLIGFEKPETGAIYYDSQDMQAVEIGSLRRQMGVVLQNDSILQGSILQNIVGSSGLGEQEAWEAARMAGFDKDIESFPMGMFTMLPAGGYTLSGGQLQRLIIARAIIRKPNLLIFDEATSALDNLTQQIVSESLERMKVTRIVIAHRLSTIIHADRIYAMQNGRVIEEGTFQELMDKNGFFAQLARRQKI